MKASALTQPSPLLVVGAPRSGNTLVRRVLLASGQIYIPPETYVLGEVIERWKRWRRLDWREKVFLFASYFDRHANWPEMDVPSLAAFVTEAVGWPEEKHDLRALLDGLYGFLARQHGFAAPRWGDKTPWNTMHLKSIVKFLPDAQFLYLVRDGRDSVASQVKADMRTVDVAVDRWVQANSACARFLPRDRTLKMSYEDIVTKPKGAFDRIFGFARMDFAPEYLTRVPANLGDIEQLDHHAAVLKPITPASIGNWKKTLNETDVARFPDAFRQHMTRHGYTG